MRHLLRPYHLMLMLAGLTALWVFKKIDKHSFYHHFFRVIEEVELRNSHDLDAADLMVLSRLQLAPRAKSLSLLPLLLALAGIFVLVLSLVRVSLSGDDIQFQGYPAPARLLPPVRAP